MTYTKGGRGLKAPYESTHVRVPVPLKAKVEGMIASYKESLDVEVAVSSLVKPENPLTDNPENLLTVNEAIEIATKILGQKKSAKISLSKLLSAIYGQEIVL